MRIFLSAAVVAVVLVQSPTTPKKGGNPEAAKIKNPVAASPESIAAGKRSYTRLCTKCHGATGAGDGTGTGAAPGGVSTGTGAGVESGDGVAAAPLASGAVSTEATSAGTADIAATDARPGIETEPPTVAVGAITTGMAGMVARSVIARSPIAAAARSPRSARR